jgi:hypothetical protein
MKQERNYTQNHKCSTRHYNILRKDHGIKLQKIYFSHKKLIKNNIIIILYYINNNIIILLTNNYILDIIIY